MRVIVIAPGADEPRRSAHARHSADAVVLALQPAADPRIARLWFVVVCAPGPWSEGRFCATGFSPRSAIGVDRHAFAVGAIAVGPLVTAEDHPAVSLDMEIHVVQLLSRRRSARRRHLAVPHEHVPSRGTTPVEHGGRFGLRVEVPRRLLSVVQVHRRVRGGGPVCDLETDRSPGCEEGFGQRRRATCGRSEAHDPRAWVYSEVDEVRLAPPVERGRPVPRPALVDQLANRSAVRIVSIAAPAGYGKRPCCVSGWASNDAPSSGSRAGGPMAIRSSSCGSWRWRSTEISRCPMRSSTRSAFS